MSKPAHIAIIMDGNGRWAKKHFMPRNFGHREGIKTLEKVADFLFDYGVNFVTVYAFSTENRSRSESEIAGLKKLIKEFFVKKLSTFIKNKMRVKTIGDISYFGDELVKIIKDAEQKTSHFIDKTLVLALNYGARDELVRAIKKGEVKDEGVLSKNLDTYFMPDPDIFIRTGGEKRLSNFLLYQLAYTELFFTDTLWPDFSVKEIEDILTEFYNRERRFGK